jgi:hypothetical protein
VRHQSLPTFIVSDRDVKFTGKFWRTVLDKHKITGLITAGYHAAANGQAERSNETIKIAWRCLLVGQYEEIWSKIIPEVKLVINTSWNVVTKRSPFKIVYGFKP